MRIAVVDGQGGGVGKHIVEKLRKLLPEGTEILALGTNALATAQMLKAGANEGASGENAIVFNASRVDLIVGPVGIVVPHAMAGELTPRIAEAITQSPAPKLLLPLLRGKCELVGIRPEPLPHLIDELVDRVKEIIAVSGEKTSP
ncbi:DUF3842 family protein [Ammonifex thiophilus]|uniref:DUF3842 family protein n=1 Tax=Ammonifex thiophilus TaxID=444093 RepID=A0A3D8P5W8_9THEO|nr:DUF3842 family protein [Ammonifex thiophilus]RDV83416.1 DUF3842 family protein [Ammonifex thiophilus]